MRERNFAVAALNKDLNGKQAKSLLQKLQAAETQAIALVKLFSVERYVTVDALLAKLRLQQVEKVDLGLVVAFLAGYLSGETFDSRFDVDVFGEHSCVSDAKSETARASLVALLTMINEKNVVKLPSRIPRRKRQKSASVLRRKLPTKK